MATGLVFATPSEAGGPLGLSAARWGLVGLLLALAAGCGGLLALGQRGHPVYQRLVAALTQPRVLNPLIALAAVLAPLCFYLILLTFKFNDAFVQARLLRLLPLTLWGLLVAVQSLVILPRLRPTQASWGAERQVWRPALFALLGLLVLAALMAASGLGLQPDRSGWDTPGTPLLNTQVTLAWLAAVVSAALWAWANRRFGWRFTRLDGLAMLALWALAAWLWIAQPMLPTYFSPNPTPPNFEFYPSSDAATLDIAAQNFLIGGGFTDVIEKPLYGMFLVVLHALAGQNYASLVNAQTLVLALFPALLYLIAARLHERLSGVLLALVVIFREMNTLALSGEILVSHSKLLMTDLPAALGLAGFTLLLLRWLQDKAASPRWALWVGATLGLLLLLRSQTIIFLPFLLLLVFWRAGGSWRPRLGLAAILLAGFLLAALPWMLRNAQRTGQFGYSQPLQALYMAKQYSLTPELGDPGFPPGTPVSEYVSLGFARVVDFTLSHPGEVVRFVSAHFLRNEVSSLLALPMRFDLADKLVTFYNLRPYWQGLEGRLWADCCSLSTYIDDTPYWRVWDGDFPLEAWLPLAFSLAMVALGIGAAWRKLGWLALVPVGIHLLYSLSSALARVSGWRLILPADWVLLLFYCLGIGQLTLWVARYLFGLQAGAPAAAPIAQQPATARWNRSLLSNAALALLAGAAIPLAEHALPDRYVHMDRVEAARVWAASSAAGDLDLDVFLQQPGARIYWGRALYPSYYAAGLGLPGSDLDAYSPQPFARLAFRLIGPDIYDQVALPLQQPPAAFPHAADVLVLGCEAEGYLRAAAVLFLDGQASRLVAGGADPFRCQ